MTATAELTAEDLFALVEYYNNLHRSITPDMFDQPNMSGGTMRDTATHYLRKRIQFQQVLNTIKS